MSESKHKPGPWIVGNGHPNMPGLSIFFHDTSKAGVWKRRVDDLNGRFSVEDATRIVACVNACEGINPEAVPELLEALEAMLATFGDEGYATEAEREARAAILKAKGL